MIRCSICKRFIKGETVTYLFNEFKQQVSNVRGKCSRCGKVDVEYDCYEDLVGFESDITKERKRNLM